MVRAKDKPAKRLRSSEAGAGVGAKAKRGGKGAAAKSAAGKTAKGAASKGAAGKAGKGAAGKGAAGKGAKGAAGKAAAAAGAPVKRRVRLDTDERRAQLLELARTVFTERAYDDVSIDDIAAAAGISKGLLYHYFPTKRDLYVAGLRETSRALIGSVSAAIDDDKPPAERVRSALDAYLEHVLAVGGSFVALMRGGVGSDPEVAAVVESTRQAFVEQFLLRSPVASAFTSDPMARLALRGWIGMVEATSIEWVSNPDVPRAKVRDMLVDNLVAVLMSTRASINLKPS